MTTGHVAAVVFGMLLMLIGWIGWLIAVMAGGVACRCHRVFCVHGAHQLITGAFCRAHGSHCWAGDQHQDQCNSEYAARLHDVRTVASAIGSSKLHGLRN
jgi:hypothetical protein